MNKPILKSFDIYIMFPEYIEVITATPQEAFTIVSMPAFAGLIKELVPCYELPEMSKE